MTRKAGGSPHDPGPGLPSSIPDVVPGAAERGSHLAELVLIAGLAADGPARDPVALVLGIWREPSPPIYPTAGSPPTN